MEKITLCGDNCLTCPRYLAQTEEGNNSAIATCRSMATDAFTMQIYKLFLNGVLPVAVIFVAVPYFCGCSQV